MAGETITPPGGKNLEASFIQRVSAGVRYAFTGRAPEGWFGPGLPVRPVAPDAEKGRAFDYQFAVNQAYRPRSETGETAIDFRTLRRMAEPTEGGFDLLRLAIETRKDQMSGQKWSIRARDGDDGGDQARAIEEQLRRPDGVLTFRQWQRSILEDLFVIDAPCIYLRDWLKGTKLPEVVDGSTIKRLLTEDGRTPLPPDSAYQQDIKGLPAFEYTLDELIYAPRNVRSHRIYGCSPVEQVIMTVNIALQRQLSQLVWFTDGTVPAQFVAVPKEWTPAQIVEMQQYFDAVLSGNLAERSKVRFVPGGGSSPTPMKDPGLKDMFDEWLARIICYAFSLSPQALVKEMNRASAQTNKQMAAEEGLEPVKLWFKDTMDEVLLRAFNAPDLEFAYQDEEISDPTVKVQVVSTLAGQKPVITVDEARKEYGYDPLTQKQKDELAPPPPEPKPEPGKGDDGAPPGAADEKKIAKAIVDELAGGRRFVAKTMTRKENAPVNGATV